MDPRLYFTLTVSVLHTVTLLVGWGLASWMLRRGWLPAYQVASGQAPGSAQSRPAILEVLGGQIAFGLLAYLLVYPLWRANGGSFAPAASLLQMAGHLLVFILCEDTIFYWAHRGLHMRWWFRHVHARHHRFRYVRGFTAEYAHIAENWMNLVAFFAGPILLGSPFAIVALWIVVRMLETAEAHSGYAFSNSASRHAFHHLYPQRGCYGSFFSPWDRLLDTDRTWRENGKRVSRDRDGTSAAAGGPDPS
jgi:4-alpha-methyl-delta7-sterol-4alpha-methyl oxidase